MFEKNMRIAYLLDFYGDVLDDHSRSIMKAYYEDDLSLSEIADGESISRQGVRHIIKKCEEELEFLETKLALAKYFSETEEAIDTLLKVEALLLESNDPKYKGLSHELHEAIGKIKR